MLNKVIIIKVKGKARELLWTFLVGPKGLLSLSIGRNQMIPWLVIQKLKENSMIFLKFVRKSQGAFKGILGRF